MQKLSELDELFLKRKGIKKGIERVKEAYTYLPCYKKMPPIIHVGGTNGKGTVTGLITYYIKKMGKKVGLFSSPHILSICERFYLSSRMPQLEEIEHLLKEVKTYIPKNLWNELSFFEISTLMAFMLFYNEKVDYAVIEVGMGGRWDSTNICDPMLSIITNVDYDHMEFLGSTLSQIAEEKLGILRMGVPLVWGYSKVNNSILKKYIDQGYTILKVFNHENIEHLTAFELNQEIAIFSSKILKLHAEKVSRELLIENENPIPTFLCRLQEFNLKDSIKVLVDVAHNPAGVLNLVQFHLASHYKACLVSFLDNKDIEGMLNHLKDFKVFYFKMKENKNPIKQELKEKYENVIFFNDLDSAYFAITKEFKKFIVCGSFYAVSEFLKLDKVSITFKRP